MSKRTVTFRQDLIDKKIILSLQNVKQFFDLGGGEKTKAVHDVSFDIFNGECFGLVGESGCGKTTTGRSIIRLYNITSGSIYYKGYRISGGTRWNEKEIKWSRIHTKEKIAKLKAEEKDEISDKSDPTNDDNDIVLAQIHSDYRSKIGALKEEEKEHINHQKDLIKQIRYDNKHVDKKLVNEIQMIFQDPVDSLDPRMTVEDIIQEGLKIQHQYNKAANTKKCAEMLEKVGLIPEYASRYPHEFSGGQRQRIGIARALIMNPKFLICDEPISALDVSIRAQIINLLNDLKEEMGLTMLFIAHDLSVVKYFCDRIAVMYYGNLVELAPSDELFLHPLHPYTKSLLSAIPKPDPLSEKNRVRIVYNPSQVHDYSNEKPNFQEILPGHFVLANSVEMKKYQKEISDIDKAALKTHAAAIGAK
jgi:oligopeptide transport system ATP-binding protein